MERLGQLVIGFPGAGKTTYCSAMSQFLTSLQRPNLIVNLDPASETHSYTVLPTQCGIDIRDLITLEDAMAACDLGPNGAMLFCMQVIERNVEWLVGKLQETKEPMVIFDCPGQVELYVQESSLKRVFKCLESRMRLAVVSLMDSNICATPYSYLAGVVSSTAMMTCLELPHVNVLTKVDLLANFYDGLRFDLSYYGNCQELERLSEEMDGKRAKVARKLADVIERFALVAYLPLSVEDKDTMLGVLKQVDRALGCGFLYSSSFDEELDSAQYGLVEEKYAKKSTSNT